MKTYELRNYWVTLRSRPILRPLAALQKRIGTYVRPYYVVLEGGEIKKSPPAAPVSAACEMGSFDSGEMRLMSSIPGRRFSEEELTKRLEEGKRCYGLKTEGQMAAFTWVDFKEFGMRTHRFLLKENEAYLFDAYTLPEHRGKGLAPVVRYYAYERLEAMGKKRLYSITDFFNVPSIRFKKKLGAKIVELRLLFLVFNRKLFDIRLRKYT